MRKKYTTDTWNERLSVFWQQEITISQPCTKWKSNKHSQEKLNNHLHGNGAQLSVSCSKIRADRNEQIIWLKIRKRSEIPTWIHNSSSTLFASHTHGQ